MNRNCLPLKKTLAYEIKKNSKQVVQKAGKWLQHFPAE
jgi:hypothetical protein